MTEIYKDKTKKASERAADLLSRMNLREKLMIIVETSKENERLGIPAYNHGNEALHGVVRPGKATVFPQAIALGAMFDPELLEEIAGAISDESRAMYHHGCGEYIPEDKYYGRYNGLLTFWSPDLNLCRDPRWGRTGETYGEDPYLAGKNGAAFVRGLQGNDPEHLKAVATPKHFTANNEEHNRFSCNAVMSEKTFREYHLEPFRIAVEEGHPAAVMAAYNAINDVPCHESERLLTEILRGEWGFDGYVVSDCSGIARLWDAHHKHENPEDAASAALNAGVDLECGSYSPYEHFYLEFLEKQLNDGKTTEARIDEACLRVLTARFLLGQFDPKEESPYDSIPLSVIGSEKHQQLAYRAAIESISVLKNNGILPLGKDKKIAVVGNNAGVAQFGDYSGVSRRDPVTPAHGISSVCGDNAVIIPWNYHLTNGQAEIVTGSSLLAPDGSEGLMGEYYANAGFLGEAKTRTDKAIDFAWRDQMPDSYIVSKQYSIRWSGFICPPKSGVYLLRLKYSGTAPCEPPVVTIDGKDIGTEAAIQLDSSCRYPVTVEYRKSAENPSVKLEWILPEDGCEDPFIGECKAAAEADVTVAVVGLGREYECEGRDKDYLGLPPEQEEFLRRLFEVSENVVVVLINGSPVSVPEIHEKAAAVVEAWYPGEDGGDAIADIIFGNVNPSARLCATFPFSAADLPAFDDYEMSHGRTYMYSDKIPLYPFGFGLSYTKYEYDNLDISSNDDKIKVKLSVSNIGERDGDEVVQLYVNSAGMDNMPKYRLIRFKRVNIPAGQSADVEFEIALADFELWGEDGIKRLYHGEYTFYAAGSLPTERSVELGAAKWLEVKYTI